MLRLGPYPPPLFDISDPEDSFFLPSFDLFPPSVVGCRNYGQRSSNTFRSLPATLNQVASPLDDPLEPRCLEILEAKPESVQEHINAVLGFSTFRRLGQVQEANVPSELEAERREELHERALEALKGAVQRRAAEEKYAETAAAAGVLQASPQLSVTSVTTGTPSSSQSEVGSNGGVEEDTAWEDHVHSQIRWAAEAAKFRQAGARGKPRLLKWQLLPLRPSSWYSCLEDDPTGDEERAQGAGRRRVVEPKLVVAEKIGPRS
ncbi:unnamed protein product [Symbiodinium natans]|uniref:Uncharacterized protein n=1 Tax=Symbiodinium natans TaxID=878477 RepID=A0A812R6Y0_9DINO|nr:unnamed protein product [Symbiodinium natans]